MSITPSLLTSTLGLNSIFVIFTVIFVTFPTASVAIKSKLPFSVNVWLVEFKVPSSVVAVTVIGLL